MKLKSSEWIYPFILTLAVFLVFGNSLFFSEKLLDDIIYLGRSHLLEFSLENLKFWWSPTLGLRSPLTGYSFMFDQLIWGKDNIIFGAHLMNTLLHLLAAGAFYLTARYLRFSPWCAGLMVLFWAVHPQRAESVAWLAERKDVQLLALGMWSLFLFIRAKQLRSIPRYTVSVFLFLLSFMVKPALMGMPVVLCCYLWGRYRRKEPVFYLKYTWIYWLIPLGYISGLLMQGTVPGAGDSSGADAIPVIGWRFGNYFWKTFFPVGLNSFYPHFSLAHDSLIPFYASGVLGLLMLWFLRRGNRKVMFFYLPLAISFAAAVFPALARIGDVDFADRYSYFPSVFAVTAAGGALCTLARRFPQSKIAVNILIVCVLCFMGGYCFKRTFIWQSNENFSADALDCSHPNYRIMIADIVKKFELGDYQSVEKNLERLHSEYSDSPERISNTIRIFSDSMQGMILLRFGKLKDGMAKIEAALLDPGWNVLLNSTYDYPRKLLLTAAGVYQRAKLPQNAAVMYRRIAGMYQKFEPLEFEFYSALAELAVGNKSAAIKHFENALRYAPGDENIRKNLENLRRK